ncbi:hypothetical protein BH23ACT10_BH23ACT10_35080 [soil metagenome]
MGEDVRSEQASEIPSHNLPGIGYEDLPEPIALRKLVGPGVVLLAGSWGPASTSCGRSLPAAPVSRWCGSPPSVC